MLNDLIVLILISSLVVVPLLWRDRQDRRTEAALKLQARLQSRANQRLGGETFLVVTVEPAIAAGRGRVVLSAPARWSWLVDEVWAEMRDAIPAGYDLVVPTERLATARPVRAVTRERVA
jgi:hypothetical protein